ncbi:MAG: GGDEF domain-containing protein, partial [bacterium]
LDYLQNVRKILQAPKIVPTKSFERTKKQAETDALTGLANVRTFWERLSADLDAMAGRSSSRGAESPAHPPAGLAVAMMDLDRFKRYNDTRGHQAGDVLLQNLAELLRQVFRREDLPVRYGGDEFAAILPRTSQADAQAVLERVRARVESEFREAGVTVSIGLAVSPQDGETPKTLVARADELLYRVKEFGKNRVGGMKTIRLVYRPDPQAGPLPQQVTVVGDFNGWDRA